MKKVEFSFSNAQDAEGPCDGIGIRPGLLLTDAEYYDTVGYDNNFYLVAKVTKDEYNRYPQLLDKFIVRPALVDLYPDGSGYLFLDQEQTDISMMLETHLNSAEIKPNIQNPEDIFQNCNNISRSNKAIQMATSDPKFIATSITHEAFERKRNALNHCHDTFSTLQEQVESINEQYHR